MTVSPAPSQSYPATSQRYPARYSPQTVTSLTPEMVMFAARWIVSVSDSIARAGNRPARRDTLDFYLLDGARLASHKSANYLQAQTRY
ncbi:uncharacterized protein ANIA_11308 [Aspergillus nidulans FGSC A4]|uniref:Uncharacterized protein n=1 Tax=Emericella nidulans (strain FGSC A4 / ATCC 38163 / CBS 112.46 / NRRL 194 / M139) TaxID=227321 RepID=C8VN13_EMENI|nr:hypothetical protein [Aspergillus nidulans FGSC A4]CBF85136.1 TPA: hypothetical protein ANIA_11308 [Aspergillus nidulans FGSC A4]